VCVIVHVLLIEGEAHATPYFRRNDIDTSLVPRGTK
jgi:hypothetical protein